MTWNRVKRWIGEHSAWTVHLFSFVWLGAALLLMTGIIPKSGTMPFIGDYNPPSAPHHDEQVLCGPWLSTPVLLMAPVAALVFLVGIVRRRAGLPAGRMVVSLLWSPAICLAVLVAVDVLRPAYCKGEDGRTALSAFSWFAIKANLSLGLATFLPLLLGAMTIGWLAATLLTRHMIRHGKWEVTGPLNNSASLVSSENTR